LSTSFGTIHLPSRFLGAGTSGAKSRRWWRWPFRMVYQPCRSGQYQGEGFLAMNGNPRAKAGIRNHGSLRVARTPVRYQRAGVLPFITRIHYQDKLPVRVFYVSPCPVSEGDGTRTRNHRIDSPNTSRYKLRKRNHFHLYLPRGCTLVVQSVSN